MIQYILPFLFGYFIEMITIILAIMIGVKIKEMSEHYNN